MKILFTIGFILLAICAITMFVSEMIPSAPPWEDDPDV